MVRGYMAGEGSFGAVDRRDRLLYSFLHCISIFCMSYLSHSPLRVALATSDSAVFSKYLPV